MAEVAERLVGRVLARLGAGAASLGAFGEDQRLARWIALIHETIERERGLVAVFLYQFPYTNQLSPVRESGARLLAFSEALRRASGGFVRADLSAAELQLVVNLVSSTILQLVLDPPAGIEPRALRDELTRTVERILRAEPPA